MGEGAPNNAARRRPNAHGLSERTAWNCELAADGELTASALRVAAFVADRYDKTNHGCFATGRKKVARDLHLAESTVQTAIETLVARGWLRRVGEPSRGKIATRYALTFRVEPTDSHRSVAATEPTDLDRSVDHAQPTALDRSVATGQPTDSGSPTDRFEGSNRPAHAGRDPGIDQGMDQGGASALDVLRHAGARMRQGGRSIAREWNEILVGHSLDAVRDAVLALDPPERWPSHVRARLEAAAEMPGLEERSATPDEIRAVLGMRGPTDG